MPKLLRRVFAFLAGFLLLLSLALLWMAGGFQRPRTFTSPPARLADVEPRARTSTDAATLNVVVWNIAWGYGWGSEGRGKARPREHFEQSMVRLAEGIAKLDADLVLLQEVDFDSTRSHRFDQAEAIARRAGLPYVARAVSWEANWVPFPYWPPSEHFGHMRSGGAILSRHPLGESVVELLEKPAKNPFWYNAFYLFRFVQRSEVEIGERTLTVFNTHLDAFSTENRERQARHVTRQLAAKDNGSTRFGGDLNAVPPESSLQHGYEDEPETDHRRDTPVTLVREVPGLRDTVPPEVFGTSQERYLTVPAHAPSRKLDYLFVGEGFDVLEVRVATEVGDVSDHLPLFVRLRLR